MKHHLLKHYLLHYSVPVSVNGTRVEMSGNYDFHAAAFTPQALEFARGEIKEALARSGRYTCSEVAITFVTTFDLPTPENRLVS